jgi:hypothetical protein
MRIDEFHLDQRAGVSDVLVHLEEAGAVMGLSLAGTEESASRGEQRRFEQSWFHCRLPSKKLGEV